MAVGVGGFVDQQASDSQGEETATGGWADEQVKQIQADEAEEPRPSIERQLGRKAASCRIE